MDAPAEIKARLPIEELVGQYCQIQKKGRNFVSLCPFHNDTHPSFLISPDKGIAYCFACQTGGDVFTFYQQIEGVEFPQALKDLAEKAGVELPKEKMFTPSIKKDEKERMRECLQEALNFYHEKLKEHEPAKTYVADRKLTDDLISKFGVGYAPDSFDATYTHLLKKGYSRTEILGAGLGIQKELQEERIYDRFRNRIMFPIRDHQGNLIGFGGRTLGADDAKYINSPEGPLYNKSTILYGHSHAKEAIRASKKVILVEGYFDVIACHRIGVENVVAVSGTALTEKHVNILKRTADSVCLCLDQDNAGKQAAQRAFMLCKSQDMDVRTIKLSAGKDPDECATLAPEEMRKSCLEGGVPYLDYVFSALSNASLEKRKKLNLLLPLLESIPSAVERDDALKKSAELLGTTMTALQDDLKRAQQIETKRAEEKQREVKSPFNSSDLLLGLLLLYPKHMSLVGQLLPPEEEIAKELYDALKSLNESDEETIDLSSIPAKAAEHASVLLLYCEEHFGKWSESMALKELQKLQKKVNNDRLLAKQKELIESLRQAREEGKKMEEEKLLMQYQKSLKLSSMAT
jgi:DNA primase